MTPAAMMITTHRRQPRPATRRRYWRSALALLIAGAVVASCSKTPPRNRVSIYGIDGATWKVIDPMLAEGDLPNLRRLIDEGVRAPLRSRQPMLSPAVWTTIATGVPRARHGVDNFVVSKEKAAKRGGDNLISSRDRKAHALWTVADTAGLRSAVVGWWATYPAESIDGVVISERALKTRRMELQATFGENSSEHTGLVHPPDVMPLLSSLLAETPSEAEYPDEHQRALRRAQIEDEAVAASLSNLRSKLGKFDLEMILLRGVDIVSHHFWKYHEPDSPNYDEEARPTAEGVSLHGDTIRGHYRFVDSLIGELIAGKRPGDVTIVVSDHGFEAGHMLFKRAHLTGRHLSNDALDGIFIGSGEPFAKGGEFDTASILDVAPTVLNILGLPIADTVDGKVLTAALDPAWRGDHAPERVASYSGPPVQVGEPNPSRNLAVDDALREQLYRLGYLESPDSDPATE